MSLRIVHLIASFAVVAVSFAQSASAEQCATGPLVVKYFHPETTRVVAPTPAVSKDTTPIPVTAPQHNGKPSSLVPTTPKVVDVACIRANTELEVDVNFAQQEIGSVILHYGKFELELPVTEWSAKRIRFMTPDMGVLNNLSVSIHIYRPDGYLVRQFDAVLTRQPSIRRVVRSLDTAPLQQLSIE